MMIEKASIEDINFLVEMWGGLSDWHKDFKDYMSPSDDWSQIMRDSFIKDLEKNDRIIFIAKVNDEVVGFLRCELRVNSSIFKPMIFGYISDMYLKEEYRGTDVAENLFKRGLHWFEMKKIYDLRLNVNSENIRAIKFYKKFGFEDFNKTLGLKLEG